MKVLVLVNLTLVQLEQLFGEDVGVERSEVATVDFRDVTAVPPAHKIVANRLDETLDVLSLQLFQTTSFAFQLDKGLT